MNQLKNEVLKKDCLVIFLEELIALIYELKLKFLPVNYEE